MRVSVIIPTLNEAEELPSTLVHAAGAHEIIVADGGSTDATCALARTHGSTCVHATGRAAQLNAGAAAAHGDILLFLHADTHLPPDWVFQVAAIMAAPDIILGAFALHIRSATVAQTIIAHGATLRSRWFGLPYGDQACFIRRSDFAGLGGFASVPIMEDFMLVRAAGKRGRIAIARSAVSTSARRWQSRGTWATFWRNQRMVWGYWRGTSLAELAAYYRR
jgi:uncharacterized protein